MIPRFDLQALMARDGAEMTRLGEAVREVGFLTLGNTALGATEVERVLDAYRAFFRLPEPAKRSVDMARTGANRGWGAPKSEQVDPGANPDFKEVFDCGREVPRGHSMAARELPVYAPNLWPAGMPDFRRVVETYFEGAMDVAMEVLRALAAATGGDGTAFDRAFDPPMALLRGNYYPPRPDWAGERDFGIASHTDYGCITLLATDGVPGLEVRMPSGAWQPVRADPGEFIINFGEMLEFWTAGAAKATLHRVRGGPDERISVPLFFNPSFDANVAPPGSGKVILAGEHLDRRFSETYVHLQQKT